MVPVAVRKKIAADCLPVNASHWVCDHNEIQWRRKDK